MDKGGVWKSCFDVGTDEDIRRFSLNRGDFNPIHHDVDAAKRNKLRGIIAPGILPIERTSATIGNEMHGVMVHRLTMEFKQPMYAGSSHTILCTLVRKRRISAEIDIKIDNGFDLVAHGSCELLLPRR